MTDPKFSSLPLDSAFIKNLNSLGYETMTPIQADSLPLILKGNDVIAQAMTGSGKTATFGLGILHNFNVAKFRIQALVLCPTRELADQVAEELRKLARAIHNVKVLTLCGGAPFGPQVGSLEHGAHIIVGTPGRVEEHLRKQTLTLKHVSMVVLDEADRMLEMGFSEAIDAIIKNVPSNRQTMLFSATYPEQIKSLAAKYMKSPTMVKIEAAHTQSSIEQIFYRIQNNEERTHALKLVLLDRQADTVVIFCNTKVDVQAVYDTLSQSGFSVVALHGDLEQRDRDEALIRFANCSVNILVATDVAARGLDIDSLELVVNFHIARDSDIHTHRIGRTGRAGSKGVAVSLYSQKEHHKVALLQDTLGEIITDSQLPNDSVLNVEPPRAKMTTLLIHGGKKQKLRPGDIVGALTGEGGMPGDHIGKIKVLDNAAFVAVNSSLAKKAMSRISNGKIKGKVFRCKLLDS